MRKVFRGARDGNGATGPESPAAEPVQATLVDYDDPEIRSRVLFKLAQGVNDTPLLLRKLLEHGNPPHPGSGMGDQATGTGDAPSPDSTANSRG